MTNELLSEISSIRNKAVKKYKEAWQKVTCEFSKKEKSNDWVHPEDSLIWQEAIEIINKYLKEVEND